MSESNAYCPICMSDIASEDGNPPQNPYTLECTHTFHEDCINLWFVESPACPVCRALPQRPVFGPTRTEFQAVHPEVALPESSEFLLADITELARQYMRETHGNLSNNGQAVRFVMSISFSVLDNNSNSSPVSNSNSSSDDDSTSESDDDSDSERDADM